MNQTSAIKALHKIMMYAHAIPTKTKAVPTTPRQPHQSNHQEPPAIMQSQSEENIEQAYTILEHPPGYYLVQQTQEDHPSLHQYSRHSTQHLANALVTASNRHLINDAYTFPQPYTK